MVDKTIDTDKKQIRGDLFKVFNRLKGREDSRYALTKIFVDDNKLTVCNSNMFVTVEIPVSIQGYNCMNFPDKLPYKRTGFLELQDDKLLMKQEERTSYFELINIDKKYTPPYKNAMQGKSNNRVTLNVELMQHIMDLFAATGREHFDLHLHGDTNPVLIESTDGDKSKLPIRVTISPVLS